MKGERFPVRWTSWAEDCGLYVHVPFCVSKCGYCDFHSLAGVPTPQMAQVVDGILAEAQALGERLRPKTIFLGGGTPTHLPAPLIERLLAGLHDHFDLSACEEWTCEANPESTTKEKLQLLAAAGVSRLSLGVQSFDDEALRFLERPHDSRQARQAIELALDAGFAAVSIDLMHGLMGLPGDLWRKDLIEALRWNLPHLSCYQLTIETGTPFSARLRHGQLVPLPEDEALRQFLGVGDLLLQAGYTRYEISNFARPGFECRHNLNYWRQGDYIGLGPGAAKHRNGWRATNLRPIDLYLETVRATGCAEATAESLSPEQRTREALWLGLRLAEGVDLSRLEERLGVDPYQVAGEAIARSLTEGLMVRTGSRLSLTPRGLPVADALGQRFLA